MKILLHLSYLGSRYCGYQVQPNGITVQAMLNEAAQKLFGYACDIVGCSRTDSGVHAHHFCATVTKKGEKFLETSIPVERIPTAFSFYLPPDISVFAAEAVDENFHPRYDVKYKEYIYRIWNRRERDPFWNGRAWHCPVPIGEDAFCRMCDAARYYCGTHDFCAFMAPSDIGSTVRCVYEAELIRESGAMLVFRVSADGFLYHMVRIMTGTLIDVAYGKIEPEQIPAILEAGDRKSAGQTAPACGLYLNRVVY